MALPTVMGEFRIATEPNLRYAPSGVAVCSMRAVASSRKQVDGEWKDDKECFVGLTGFKKTGENMAESFPVGALVTVIGKISTENWEDKDGGKRTSVNLVVDSIGPSVKYDTVTINKAERASGGQSDDQWSTPPQGDDTPPF